MKTSVCYKRELESKDIKKIPKPFQSFLDGMLERSNRGLSELSENRIENEQENASDKEEETAADQVKEFKPNSSFEIEKGNIDLNDDNIFGNPSLPTKAPF